MKFLEAFKRAVDDARSYHISQASQNDLNDMAAEAVKRLEVIEYYVAECVDKGRELDFEVWYAAFVARQKLLQENEVMLLINNAVGKAEEYGLYLKPMTRHSNGSLCGVEIKR